MTGLTCLWILMDIANHEPSNKTFNDVLNELDRRLNANEIPFDLYYRIRLQYLKKMDDLKDE